MLALRIVRVYIKEALALLKMPGTIGGINSGGVPQQPTSSAGGGPTISFLSAAQLQAAVRPSMAAPRAAVAGDDLYDVEREMRNFWPKQKEKLEQMSVVRVKRRFEFCLLKFRNLQQAAAVTLSLSTKILHFC